MSKDDFGKAPKFCKHCGAVSTPKIKTVKEGSVLIALFLLLLGILPGLLYYIFAIHTDRFWVCGNCGRRGGLIPNDSLAAQMVLKSEARPYVWAASANPPAAASWDSIMQQARTDPVVAPRRQSGSVFGLTAGSQGVTTPYREAGTETPRTRGIQPARPAAESSTSANQRSSERCDRKVYTYEAPGLALCPECGERPAVFYCSYHSKFLCLHCAAGHDQPAECVYIPGWRGGKGSLI